MAVTPTRPCAHGMPSAASCIVCMDEGNIAPGHDGPGPEAIATRKVSFSGRGISQVTRALSPAFPESSIFAS